MLKVAGKSVASETSLLGEFVSEEGREFVVDPITRGSL
jgi:hypothetical protein